MVAIITIPATIITIPATAIAIAIAIAMAVIRSDDESRRAMEEELGV
jgi:hypothetical protein